MLPPSTRRRLQKLEQVPSVWEGDIRPISVPVKSSETGEAESGNCVLWVDGSEGVVRAMDMVGEDSGLEATVRTLLRAMENPHNAEPARPQKIVVKDRELLFFLRGALQELDITLDYVPDLPLIDELFRSLETTMQRGTPNLSPAFVEPLHERARRIWKDAPWEYLSDRDILRIELNAFGLESLYVSVLGLLGLDYGVLLYRSLESLKSFRAAALRHDDSMENLEKVFLSQDCFFLTYDSAEVVDDDTDLADLPWTDIDANFGSLHPLEGLRPFLYDEEALPVYVALEALHRFLDRNEAALDTIEVTEVSGTYSISIPKDLRHTEEKAQSSNHKLPKSVRVTVSSMPELSAELLDMDDAVSEEMQAAMGDDVLKIMGQLPAIQDDLVPAGSFISIGSITWDTVHILREYLPYYDPCGDYEAPNGDLNEHFPVVIVQSSRPKVKRLLEELDERGGLLGLSFIIGRDAEMNQDVELGLLGVQGGEFQIFGEFDPESPTHQIARERWDTRVERNEGGCGILFAMGVTGKNRGNPDVRDMMGFIEMPYIWPEELQSMVREVLDLPGLPN